MQQQEKQSFQICIGEFVFGYLRCWADRHGCAAQPEKGTEIIQ